jgi:gas vesicle structural protein
MGRGLRILLLPMQNDFEAANLVGASDEDVSLLDILDHVLNAGVVIHGSLVLSIAGVDLVYVGLNVVLTSVETALKNLRPAETKRNLR